MSDNLLSSIYATLAGDATLAEIFEDRIYPVVAEQPSSKPYLVFSRVSSQVGLVLAGSSNDREARVQVDAFSRRYADIDTARDALIALFHGKTGAMSSTELWQAELDSDTDLFEAEDQLYRLTIDFRFIYSVEP
jgi:hypothetical protein